MFKITKLISIILLFLFIPAASANPLEGDMNSENVTEYENVLIKDFQIALQCWTYRKFSFMETVDKAEELGIKILQAYPGQKLNYDGTGQFNVGMSDEEIKMVREK